MLRYVSLLVLIALIWKVQPSTAADVCEPSVNVSMFCNCDPVSKDQIEITCFVYGPIDRTHEVWGSFIQHDNTVALTFRSRQPYQLTYVPTRVLQSLPSVETLTIQEGNIAVLESGDISNMPKLKELWLDRNELTSLDRLSISNLPKLQKLTLSDNLLTEILADTFNDLDELELLFLDANNISRIEGCAFCSLHNLKELELWRNSITDLTEHTFRGLRYLSRLDLYNNHLSVINDNVFQAMPKLRELNLKSNRIHYISPRAFDGLNHLSALYLNNNLLKSLPGNLFSNVPEMTVLDVSYNLLETINGEVMEGLRNRLNEYFTFYFRGNPLKCSCDFSWVQTYMKKSRSKLFVKELSQMTCLDLDDVRKEVQSLRLKECARKAKKMTTMQYHHKHHAKVTTSTTVQPVVESSTEMEMPQANHPNIEAIEGKGRKLDKNELTESNTVHTALQESPGSGGSSADSLVAKDITVLLAVIASGLVTTLLRT